MSKIISISNHKGGVGKTTSAVNIGAGLNRLGKKVLLVDTDPQANLSESLGIEDSPLNIYGLIKGDYSMTPIEILKGLDVIPSSIHLSGAEIELATDPNRMLILRELLEPLRANYDYIIIDCPPSIGLLAVNSFAASDMILIPLQAQYLALKGLYKLTDVIEQVKASLNKDLKIGGVFITQYDSRKVLNREVVASIQKKGLKVFETKVRDNIAIAEAPTQGVDIFRYSPTSKGAEDYTALCNEIVKIQ